MQRTLLAILAVLVVGSLGCASKEKTGMKIYVQNRLYDKAIEQGETALAQNPEDGDTHYFMGAAYFGKDTDLSTEAPEYGDSSAVFLERAYKHFIRAKELAESSWGESSDVNIVGQFARHNNRGIIASKNGDYVTAELEYRLATIADPENYKGYYARAGALWELAKEAQEAGEEEEFDQITTTIIENLERVLELDPEEKETRINVFQTKGDVHYKRDEHAEAQQAYQRAVQLSPENYDLILTMAERFYNDKDYENAAAYFQDALSVRERLGLIDETDVNNYSALGISLSQMERREEAIAAYERVIQIRPNDTPTLYNLMVTHYLAAESASKNGDVPTSKQHYNMAIGLGDQLIGLEPGRADFWRVRGLCKRGVGDFAGAARDLKEFQDLKGGGGGR
jgi:tetratricopeptide (TPR) repeat protein